MTNHGFTMIELMIVILIIGFLGVMGGSTYIRSLHRGRDAKRIEDVQSVQKGFELYYTLNDSGYGNCTDTMGKDSRVFPHGLPVDPDGSSYLYNNVGNTDACGASGTYCVCAVISSENRSMYGNATKPDCTDINTNHSTGDQYSNNQYYCLQNVQ